MVRAAPRDAVDVDLGVELDLVVGHVLAVAARLQAARPQVGERFAGTVGDDACRGPADAEEALPAAAPVGTQEVGARRAEQLVDLLGLQLRVCLLYTSPSPRDRTRSRMPSSA